MFEHLTNRAEIIEARLAKYMGNKADAIQERYSGRKGKYLAIAFGFGYYLFSSLFLPLLTGFYIFLYIFLRYVLPAIYAFLCVIFLASMDKYIIESNVIWASENYRFLALRVFSPLLSEKAITAIHIVIPVFLLSALFISLATAIAILYRKAIFVDTTQ